jgi:hypothetical protein
MIVGGHLDSVGFSRWFTRWCWMCARNGGFETFKKLNYKPKNTIRVVLFMNEENGGRGGKNMKNYPNKITKTTFLHSKAIQAGSLKRIFV